MACGQQPACEGEGMPGIRPAGQVCRSAQCSMCSLWPMQRVGVDAEQSTRHAEKCITVSRGDPLFGPYVDLPYCQHVSVP